MVGAGDRTVGAGQDLAGSGADPGDQSATGRGDLESRIGSGAEQAGLDEQVQRGVDIGFVPRGGAGDMVDVGGALDRCAGSQRLVQRDPLLLVDGGARQGPHQQGGVALLRLADDQLWNLADERLQRELGVSIGVCETLRTIADTAPSRVQDIAAQLVITVGGASKGVDRLEVQGLCARRANPDDRRSSIVELTPAGEDLLQRSNVVLERVFGDVFGAALSESELERLHESLRKVRAAVPDTEAAAK
jgi:DNA-binding MarR family transcriptional regulator